jgi:hypothetical protein
MNLGELEGALDLIIQDKSLRIHFKTWINIALLELATAYELPALKLREPVAFPVTDDEWLFDLPEIFLKTLFRCADSNYQEVRRHRFLDALDRRDLDHDEIGEHVTHVATTEPDDGGRAQIGVYPKANESLRLWFYRKPVVLVKPGDIPDCIPAGYHSRVLIPKAALKGFEHLQDQVINFDPKALQYWKSKLAEGMNGSRDQGPGMINYLVKAQGGPRRHGGRDPIGWREYWRGN